MNGIKEIYNNMSDEELIRLTQDISGLREDVVPILQNEFYKRGIEKEAKLIEDFLNKEDTTFELSKEELKNLVDERLQSGESIESIKIDLNDHGINILDIIDQDTKLIEKSFDLIVDLKEQGLENDEIDAKLSETLSIQKEDIDLIKTRLKKRGILNIIIGSLLLIFLSIMIIFTLGGDSYIVFKGLTFLLSGGFLLIKGYKQIKS